MGKLRLTSLLLLLVACGSPTPKTPEEVVLPCLRLMEEGAPSEDVQSCLQERNQDYQDSQR